MKKLISITLALLGLTAGAQPFVNTNTGQYAATLPNQIAVPGGTLSNPTSNELVQLGWLTISNTIAPAYGWITTSNAVVPYVPINGWCYLLPAESNNVQAAFNASVTNSPLWSAGFSATCEAWASVLDAYDGPGAETNAVVNWQTASIYFATNQTFIAIPTNAFNASWLVAGATPMLQFGFTDTASFFKWYRAYITNK